MNYNFLHYSGKKVAYFQYLDIDEIVRILVEGDRLTLHTLQEVFKNRYSKVKTEIDDIEKENPFLEELKNKLESKIADIEKEFGNTKTPKSFLLQSFIDNAIKPFINTEDAVKKINNQ